MNEEGIGNGNEYSRIKYIKGFKLESICITTDFGGIIGICFRDSKSGIAVFG